MENLDNKTGPELRQMLEEAHAEVEETAPEVDTSETQAESESESDPMAEINAKLSALEKRVQDKEAFIQRQAKELGELRKSAKPKVTDEEFLSNPVATLDKLLQEKAEEATPPAPDHAEKIRSWVPDFDKRVDQIVKVMKADGVDDDFIAKYRENPAGFFPAEVSFQLAKRAELQAKLDEMAGKTERINKTISQVSASKPVTGKATTTKPISVKDLDKMSRDELMKLREQFRGE